MHFEDRRKKMSSNMFFPMVLLFSLSSSVVDLKECIAVLDPECIAQDHCNPNGECIIMGNKCPCFKLYVDCDGNTCWKERKSKHTAFLFSFFVGGCGADWFYLSEGDLIFVLVGLLKIFLFGVTVSLMINLYCVVPIMVTLMPGVLIWWLVDWIRIASGSWDTTGNSTLIYQDM